jgi:hypothetical protein
VNSKVGWLLIVAQSISVDPAKKVVMILSTIFLVPTITLVPVSTMELSKLYD